MPSDRSTGSDCGLLARSRSSRATASGPPALAPPVAHAATPRTMATKPTEGTMYIISLLPIRIEHVFEAHPLRVEEQVDISHVPVTILSHEKLRCPLDVARAVIHPLRYSAITTSA